MQATTRKGVGKQKQKTRPITCVNCQVEIQVKYGEEKRKYVVSKFNPNHNHSLVAAHQPYFIRANWKVSSSTLVTTVAMQWIGVKTRQANFTRNDL